MVWIGTTRSKPKGWLALFATGILFSACASAPPHTDYFEKSGAIGEAEAFLSGEALAQRKQKMGRTHRDMKYFFATIESLRRHRKTVEITIFETFLRPYMGTHFRHVLSSREANWSPELTLLDANLLFAKAAILIELEDRKEVAKVAIEIIRRFDGMESRVVEYPIGSKSTLEDSIRELQHMRYKL